MEWIDKNGWFVSRTLIDIVICLFKTLRIYLIKIRIRNVKKISWKGIINCKKKGRRIKTYFIWKLKFKLINNINKELLRNFN